MAGNDQNTGQDPGEVQELGQQPTDSSPGNVPVEIPSGPLEGPAPASSQPSEAPKEEQLAPRTDWRDRRIGELTQRTRELRAEIERLRQATQNGAAEQPRGPDGRFQQPAGYQGPPDQALIDQQIQQRAQILADTQEFNRRCNEIAEAGRRQYADFDGQVARLVGLVDPQDPVGVAAYNEFLNAAIETGEAGKLIHALGGDLDEASRILSLPPRRMAVELTRMAARPVHELSQAPRPINPAATSAQAQRTSASPDDPGSDTMSTAEWMRRRQEQIDGRNTRR
jgi:hypothetical protein